MRARPASGEEQILAMSVRNIGFLLDRLGEDCHPLQFLRELTQNSIEAIQRSGRSGEIIWDVDWTTFDLEGVRKLCVIDTGDGMTGSEMVKFINQLSSSVAEQSIEGNYGVGAKIAAATRNTLGVIYVSWKAGAGSMIQLFRDAKTAQYGLRQWRLADGAYDYWFPVDDELRPEAIADNGTKVVLLGSAAAEDTMRPPPGAASPSRWISKYLNTRYFQLPSKVTLRAREGWEFPRDDANRNVLRTLTGQRKYLDEHAVTSGSARLADSTAHWWILREEPAVSNNSGFVESAGHVAALYRDELYELSNGRSGMSLLQQFGITFGHRYVVIYVEPREKGERSVTTNTARTNLLIARQPLPWADWAAEFRENLPDQLKQFVNSKAAAAANTDHEKAIRERLKEILNLFKLSRYRVTPDGDAMIDPETLARGGQPGTARQTRAGGAARSPSGAGTGGNVYAVFEKTDGVPGRRTNPDPFPEVNWVSVTDGTREPGDIEDRAAKYLAEQNRLLINSDFRAFNDMTAYFVNEFGGVPGVADLARDAVRAWFEQALVEAVIGVQALRNSKEWSPENVERALSDESLTAVAMQRYHVHFAVKRELGSKLGSRRA